MIHRSPLTLSVALALSAIAFTAVPAEPGETRANGQASVTHALGDLDRDHRPVDPRFAAGWARFCAQDPGRGGCEVVMRRFAERPVVGVLLAPDAEAGVRIAGVTPDGAAAAAGLKAGDRLLRIGGQAIAGRSPEARVEVARALLHDTDGKTAVTLAYVRDGREAQVSVTPKADPRIMMLTGDGGMVPPGDPMILQRIDAQGGAIEMLPPVGAGPAGVMPIGAVPIGAAPVVGAQPGVAPVGVPAVGEDVQMLAFAGDAPVAGVPGARRVVRIECKGGRKACPGPAGIGMAGSPIPGDTIRLLDAFRWTGLNLASVDAKLGRYFGTDKGVLVLSAGPMLESLEAGDVIQRVDGRPVATPRAVMDALRGKPADSRVPVDYLRDRKAASAKIRVPAVPPIDAIAPLPAVPAMAPLPGMPMAGVPVDGVPVGTTPLGAMPADTIRELERLPQPPATPVLPAGAAQDAQAPMPAPPLSPAQRVD